MVTRTTFSTTAASRPDPSGRFPQPTHDSRIRRIVARVESFCVLTHMEIIEVMRNRCSRWGLPRGTSGAGLFLAIQQMLMPPRVRSPFTTDPSPGLRPPSAHEREKGLPQNLTEV